MTDSIYPSRVTLGEDGVYRWSYDMDLYRDHSVVRKVLLIMGVVFLSVLLFITAAAYSCGTLSFALLFPTLVCMAAAVLLFLLGYWIYLMVLGGVYRFRYEMDENGITSLPSEAAGKAANTVAAVSAAAGVLGMLAGKTVPSPARSASLACACQSGARTAFRSVRKIRQDPEKGIIRLRCLISSNQIRVGKDDYVFVCSFLRSHVSCDAARDLSD